MTKQALMSLLGVAMLGVACGTSPTAVEEAGLAVSPEGGTARASYFEPVPTSCKVLKVLVWNVTPNEPGYVAKSIRVRAAFYDARGSLVSIACGGPTWKASDSAIVTPHRFDAFLGVVSGKPGKHLVKVEAEGGASAEVVVHIP